MIVILSRGNGGILLLTPFSLIHRPQVACTSHHTRESRTSTLHFLPHIIALPLIYMLSWRCGAQFVAIDQDGDGRVSYEELRACSYFWHPLASLVQSSYRSRALKQ